MVLNLELVLEKQELLKKLCLRKKDSLIMRLLKKYTKITVNYISSLFILV